ncbi:MAG TPA: phosphatase PAP2 family protein [Sphingomicrobium sp.]
MPPEPPNAQAWNCFADVGRALLVGSAVFAPLWRRDTRTSFNALTAVLATSAGSKATKAFWRERRPNGENNKSFPSAHAGDCFAAAVSLHRSRGDLLGPLAIGLATAVSMARVFSGKHHIADVIAGSALGVVAAELAAELGT